MLYLEKKFFRGKRMKAIKKSLILILLLALILHLAACGEEELVTKQIFAMDTSHDPQGIWQERGGSA
jgi:hypothetical protein